MCHKYGERYTCLQGTQVWILLPVTSIYPNDRGSKFPLNLVHIYQATQRRIPEGCILWLTAVRTSNLNLYSRITSTNSPSYCTTIFSASLTNITALLPQSHDYSCYVSRPILAPPPLWLQKHTDLRVHDFAHPPDLFHQPRLAKITCARNWRLRGINPAINMFTANQFG